MDVKEQEPRLQLLDEVECGLPIGRFAHDLDLTILSEEDAQRLARQTLVVYDQSSYALHRETPWPGAKRSGNSTNTLVPAGSPNEHSMRCRIPKIFSRRRRVALRPIPWLLVSVAPGPPSAGSLQIARVSHSPFRWAVILMQPGVRRWAIPCFTAFSTRG